MLLYKMFSYKYVGLRGTSALALESNNWYVDVSVQSIWFKDLLGFDLYVTI